MNFSTPKPDPLLTQEAATAKSDNIDAIRTRVSSLTDDLVRTYGARVALAGTAPTSAPILGGAFNGTPVGSSSFSFGSGIGRG